MPANRETVTFDYGIPAELFMGKRKGGARQPLRYRRFATAAEAIRFAVGRSTFMWSRNCRPRLVYFLAMEMTRRRFASTISFLAWRDPGRQYRPDEGGR